MKVNIIGFVIALITLGLIAALSVNPFLVTLSIAFFAFTFFLLVVELQ